MTTPNNTTIGVSDVRTEAGITTHDVGGGVQGSDLYLLNGYIRSDQRPANPNMAGFWNKAYYQRNMDGNCTNNGANCESNCNCNCGNVQCNATANCSAVDCRNCDSQSWLQVNCNCNPTYNCNSNQNCYSYNCNCSKIICTKLFELGMMTRDVFEADQRFGEIVRANNPDLYNGYVAWAEVVVDWMSGKGPKMMPWMSDEDFSKAAKKWSRSWAYDIATPWAEYMAYRMGEMKTVNKTGLVLHVIGGSISKIVGTWNKLFGKKNKPAGFATGLSLIFIFVILKGIVTVGKLLGSKTKEYANV